MNKVEEVARAIGEAARRRHGGTLMAWAVSPERQDCLEFARAAIAAMREPTRDMIDAGEGADDHSTRYAEAADCLAHWHAMIDAALGEMSRRDEHASACDPKLLLWAKAQHEAASAVPWPIFEAAVLEFQSSQDSAVAPRNEAALEDG